MIKHRQRKLQKVYTTCGSGMLAPVDRRKRPQAQDTKVKTQGAKVKASISAGSNNCGLSLGSTGARIPLAHVVVVTSCNVLALVVFFHSVCSADSPFEHLYNLCWWCFFI